MTLPPGRWRVHPFVTREDVLDDGTRIVWWSDGAITAILPRPIQYITTNLSVRIERDDEGACAT